MTPGRSPLVLRKVWLRPGLWQWAVVTIVVFSMAAWRANTGARAVPRLVRNLPLGRLRNIPLVGSETEWFARGPLRSGSGIDFPAVLNASLRWLLAALVGWFDQREREAMA